MINDIPKSRIENYNIKLVSTYKDLFFGRYNRLGLNSITINETESNVLYIICHNMRQILIKFYRKKSHMLNKYNSKNF